MLNKERTNFDRAKTGEAGVKAAVLSRGDKYVSDIPYQDRRDAIADVMSDMLHYAALLAKLENKEADVDALLWSAKNNFESEVLEAEDA